MIKLLNKIGKFKNGIELGSGEGANLKILRKYGPTKGLDRNKLNNVDIVADMQNTGLPDNSFDFVFTHISLNHVDDLNKTAKEIARICKGKILIIEPADCIGYRILLGFKKFKLEPHKGYKILRLMIKKDLKKLFESVGFKTIETGNYRPRLKHWIRRRNYYIGKKR